MTLPRAFFLRPTLTVAKDLLGATLCTEHRGVITSGKITEVEAYHYTEEASHAFRGQTKRNAAMFKAGGHCYVYFIYGVHYCVNVVTEAEGEGCAVLIRALEPLEGIEIMKRRRGVKEDSNLTSGPGKICQALRITPKFQGKDLTKRSGIWLEPRKGELKGRIERSSRIGISKAKDLDWRFVLWDGGNRELRERLAPSRSN